jgi:methionyl-tRNA formyltransferase
MGTPDFSVPTLDILHNHPLIDLCLIISMPDRPKGRGHELSSPAVIDYAKSNNIPYYQTVNINRDDELVNRLDNIDLVIVLAFAQFLGDKWLNKPQIGCFNIHTSMLPKYRGAAPIQYALLNGDQSTAVSIQKMVKKMDAGDIVHSNSLNIFDYENGGLLYARLKFQAAICLAEFIDQLSKNNIQFTKQDEAKVTFAPSLSRDDGKLLFLEKTAIEIYNQVRALDPWPGTFCLLNGKRLKVLRTEIILHLQLAPLELSLDDNKIIIGCKIGAIRLIEVQLDGKKRTQDSELINGLRGQLTIE